MSPKTTNAPIMLFIPIPEKVKEEIARQIDEGKRPLNWNTVDHPDNEVWTRLLELHPEAGVMITI